VHYQRTLAAEQTCGVHEICKQQEYRGATLPVYGALKIGFFPEVSMKKTFI
jgi:hypothetical protein